MNEEVDVKTLKEYMRGGKKNYVDIFCAYFEECEDCCLLEECEMNMSLEDVLR